MSTYIDHLIELLENDEPNEEEYSDHKQTNE